MFGLKTFKAGFAYREHEKHIQGFKECCEAAGMTFPVPDTTLDYTKLGMLLMHFLNNLATSWNQSTKVDYSQPNMIGAYLAYLDKDLKVDSQKALALATALQERIEAEQQPSTL